MRAKNNLFAFRVNDKDAEKIRKNIEKSGLSMSDYLSSVCLKGQVISHIDALKLKGIADELHRQGNNLNQIARRLNSGEKASPDFRELVKLYRELFLCLQPKQ